MMNAAADDRAEILHRVCRQADAGEYPTSGVLGMLSGWREIFEEHPLLDSPSYHARTFFRWPGLGDRPGHPRLLHVELVDAPEMRGCRSLAG